MNKEIRQAEEQHALRLQEKAKQQEEIEKTRTKRLSKYKFQEDGTTYQLSEDLCGSLRELRVRQYRCSIISVPIQITHFNSQLELELN